MYRLTINKLPVESVSLVFGKCLFNHSNLTTKDNVVVKFLSRSFIEQNESVLNENIIQKLGELTEKR